MESRFLFFIFTCTICVLPVLCINYKKLLFEQFMKTFNKSQLNNETEYENRFQIFLNNLEVQESLNKANGSASTAHFGINKFSDLSEAEFKELYLSNFNSNNSNRSVLDPTVNILKSVGVHVKNMDDNLPKKVDWRTHGIISKVRDQGSCGDCWAYTTTELVEAMYAKKSGHLTPLSSQEVLDCSFGFPNLYGCKGGDTCSSLKWMHTSKTPIVPAAFYPASETRQACDSSRIQRSSLKVNISDFTCINFAGNEDLLLQTIASHGPVAVAVDATSWQNYLGGVLQHTCGKGNANNHAVIIIGYDLEAKVPHYIVKNSWGEDFGDFGYLYIAIDKNMCGIAREVSTVDVE